MHHGSFGRKDRGRRGTASQARRVQAGWPTASMMTVTVRPTMPFFLVTPKLVRSRRAVARNRTISPSARAPLTLTCAGTGVPCAVTEPVTTQSAPSRRDGLGVDSVGRGHHAADEHALDQAQDKEQDRRGDANLGG